MENQKLTPEIIDALKTEHGEISQIEGIEHDVVIKAPTPAQYRRFMDLSSDMKKREKAKDALLGDCVVFPETAAFAELTDAKPGYRETITNVILELSGIVQDATAKKL
ncbi:hypothetical protein Q0M94_03435 [Deinococcus radiomollis]|uniref:hypothetical protein n=1 Tax=Deinococcus radiomollis TaxID=468916 RepID=UPI0038915D21